MVSQALRNTLTRRYAGLLLLTSPWFWRAGAAFGQDETLIALCAEIEHAAPWAHRRPAGYA